MKTILKLILMAVFLLPTARVIADSKNDGQVNSKKVVPVELHQLRDAPKTYSLSMGLESLMVFEPGEVSFLFPFDTFPVEVEITGEGMTRGLWTSVLSDASEPMAFDGEAGDYCLTVVTPDDTYIGYFTLE